MKRLTREDYEDAAAKAMLYSGGYAKAVYRNALVDIARKKRVAKEVPLEGDCVAQQDIGRAVEVMDVVLRLRPSYRDAILAKAQYGDDKSAAASLGLPVATFKTRLHRARCAAIAAMGGGL